MKIADLKIGVRLGILAGLLLVGIAIVGLQGWSALSQNNQRTKQALENSIVMGGAIDSARHAQVLFKTQIQEWKNTLLRGNKAENFEKYRQAFIKEGNAAQESLVKLKEVLTKLGLQTKEVDEAKQSLADLQSRYLEALKKYDVNDKESANIVDAAVRGMDRAPTEKINAIVGSVLEQSKKMAEAAEAESMAAYKSAVGWIMTVVGLTILLGIVVTVWITGSITRPIHEAVQVI